MMVEQFEGGAVPSIQVFLSLIIALNRLARAATSKAMASKETVITERHIRLVAKVSQLVVREFVVVLVTCS